MFVERKGSLLRVGALHVSAHRWPGQSGYGWRPTGGPTAPMNQSGARFGAGWRWSLGVKVGGSSAYVDLLFGSLRVWWEPAAERRRAAAERAEAEKRLSEMKARWKREDEEHRAEMARARERHRHAEEIETERDPCGRATAAGFGSARSWSGLRPLPALSEADEIERHREAMGRLP